MPFRSILFGNSNADAALSNRRPPACFGDLNLDQIVASITANRDEYDLEPYFYVMLQDVETIEYRHNIMRDLENVDLASHIRLFAQQMRTMRLHLARADKVFYPHERKRWFLEAACVYCNALRQLVANAIEAQPQSSGFRNLIEYIANYIASATFMSLADGASRLKAELNEIHYSLNIVGTRITVDRYRDEPDYSAEVTAVFKKFREADAKNYQFTFSSESDMNHVEAGILDLIVKLYPQTFDALNEFLAGHRSYIDRTIEIFDREVQFYLAYIEFIQTYKQSSLPFCYPVVTRNSKEIHGNDIFDLALAQTLIGEDAAIVLNDFYLCNPERIFVVSGPNQGGKTTFARAFGQLHYLASLGCPVPAKDARLYLPDRIFTHFEKAENLQDLSGKLEDDLRRIHRILEQATPDSLLIMNESFASTSLSDALFLSKKIMRQIIESDMLCVSVTFLDELANLSASMVSMVSMVRDEGHAVRTFRITRKAPGGLVYAIQLAAQHHLDYESIRRRTAS